MEKKVYPGKVSLHKCEMFPKEKEMKKRSLDFEIKSPEYKGNPVFLSQKS